MKAAPQPDQADDEASEFRVPALFDCGVPSADVVGVNPQQHYLLAERHRGVSGELVLFEQALE